MNQTAKPAHRASASKLFDLVRVMRHKGHTASFGVNLDPSKQQHRR